MTPEEYKRVKEQLDAQAAKLLSPTSYYDGDHRLNFATKKFTNAFGSLFKAFAINLCPPVIQAVRDNLEIENFEVEAGGDLSVAAWKLWQRNRMALRAGEIHKSALRDGDAFLIVTRDSVTNEVRFHPQSAASCTVVYDTEIPGNVLFAAKYWVITDPDDAKKKRVRLTAYYRDRSERYITLKNADTLPDDFNAFQEYSLDGTAFDVKHELEGVPVFHFGNDTDLGKFGQSELKSVIPVQDALNKSVCDMLVAMEFAAFRQRWVSGLELDLDNDGNPVPPFKSGIDRIWTVDTPDTKFGDFATTDLNQFLQVKNSFRLDVAMVSGTPLHYFMPVGADFPSGEAIKKAETRFIKKVENRQLAFGAVWEDAVGYALALDGKGKDIRLFASFKSPAELGESEQLDILVKKQTLDVPDEQLWVEAGYGESDVKRFAELKTAAAQRAADQFNTGILPGA